MKLMLGIVVFLYLKLHYGLFKSHRKENVEINKVTLVSCNVLGQFIQFLSIEPSILLKTKILFSF